MMFYVIILILKDVVFIKSYFKIILVICLAFVFGSGFTYENLALPVNDNNYKTNEVIQSTELLYDTKNTDNNLIYDEGIVKIDNPTSDNDRQDISYKDMDCYGLLGMPEDPNSPAYWLQLALKIMRYVAIAALLILSTIDFVMAITKQDNDALKKAIQTTIKRFIFAVLLFFVPLLTEFIMDFFGVYGTCAL